MLMGLGFSPLAASGMSMLADTATVAFGALGAPITALSASTGLDPMVLSKIIGRQSAVFSMIIPFVMIYMFCGLKKMWEVWPALLVAALGFTIPSYLISNYSNPVHCRRGGGRQCPGLHGVVPARLAAQGVIMTSSRLDASRMIPTAM